MNKKIMPRVLSILLAIVLFAMAPIFLTACGTPAELNAVAKAAAKDYYKNHVDYENFANTTYVYEQTKLIKNTFELEYLASAEATEKTKTNFTNVNELNVVYNFSIVNVGERVAVVIDVNAVSTEKSYNVDENDLLEEINDTSNRHTIYKLSFAEVGEDVTYYLTKEYEVKNDEDEVVEAAKYYRIYEEDEYIEEVENILSHINRRLVEDGYFEIVSGEVSMFYGNIISVEGSGSNVKAKLNYDSFTINGSDVMEIAMNFEIGFENNKIGKITLDQKMDKW